MLEFFLGLTYIPEGYIRPTPNLHSTNFNERSRGYWRLPISPYNNVSFESTKLEEKYRPTIIYINKLNAANEKNPSCIVLV